MYQHRKTNNTKKRIWKSKRLPMSHFQTDPCQHSWYWQFRNNYHI